MGTFFYNVGFQWSSARLCIQNITVSICGKCMKFLIRCLIPLVSLTSWPQLVTTASCRGRALRSTANISTCLTSACPDTTAPNTTWTLKHQKHEICCPFACGNTRDIQYFKGLKLKANNLVRFFKRLEKITVFKGQIKSGFYWINIIFKVIVVCFCSMLAPKGASKPNEWILVLPQILFE